MLERLLALGCKTAALTGVSFEPDKLGVAYLDREGRAFPILRTAVHRATMEPAISTPR